MKHICPIFELCSSNQINKQKKSEEMMLTLHNKLDSNKQKTALVFSSIPRTNEANIASF